MIKVKARSREVWTGLIKGSRIRSEVTVRRIRSIVSIEVVRVVIVVVGIVSRVVGQVLVVCVLVGCRWWTHQLVALYRLSSLENPGVLLLVAVPSDLIK